MSVSPPTQSIFITRESVYLSICLYFIHLLFCFYKYFLCQQVVGSNDLDVEKTLKQRCALHAQCVVFIPYWLIPFANKTINKSHFKLLSKIEKY